MAQCVTKVELHISCRGLLDKDTMSKSDPIATVFMQNAGGNWYEYARTERIKNTLNPDFSQAVPMDYYFEMVQKLKFTVHDVDNATKKLDDDDFLGSMECTLGQIVSKRSFSKHLEIKKRQVGTITVHAEEIKGGNEIAKLTMRATNLDKKDFLGKSDPFLEISKVKSDGGLLMVHRTEFIKNNLNPHWRTFEIPVGTLCSGDYDATIKINCFDYDSDGTHDFIGSTSTTLRQLIDTSRSGKGFDLINPKKQSKKKYVNSGVLYISQCEIAQHYSFLDYIMGGCQINFTVGIDFTGSNGDPKHPQSLHYMNPYEPNEYLKALTAVGNVCQDYDTDKLFPAFGFGAQVPPAMKVSHQFALNFQDTNPYCQGITGVVAAYQACISQVRLYGPTNVSPIIRHVTQFAYQAAQQGNAEQYFILLILTDGVISDMDLTKLAIVKASRVPMSIIIVGVGPADFTDMNELDADDGLLRAGTEIAERDIVQFVPFREFKGQSPIVLAQHVLAEVPKQVQAYFNKRKITPLRSTGPEPPSLAGL